MQIAMPQRAAKRLDATARDGATEDPGAGALADVGVEKRAGQVARFLHFQKRAQDSHGAAQAVEIARSAPAGAAARKN